MESNAQGVGKVEIGFTAGQAFARYGVLQTMRVLLIIHASILVLYAVSSVYELNRLREQQ